MSGGPRPVVGSGGLCGFAKGLERETRIHHNLIESLKVGCLVP